MWGLGPKAGAFSLGGRDGGHSKSRSYRVGFPGIEPTALAQPSVSLLAAASSNEKARPCHNLIMVMGLFGETQRLNTFLIGQRGPSAPRDVGDRTISRPEGPLSFSLGGGENNAGGEGRGGSVDGGRGLTRFSAEKSVGLTPTGRKKSRGAVRIAGPHHAGKGIEGHGVTFPVFSDTGKRADP